MAKPFTDYTSQDFKALASTNLEGFIYISQLAIKQMVAQRSGGSIISITSSLAEHPIADVNAAVVTITKDGIDAATRNLAMEYAKEGIRVNAVAPGIVDTRKHNNDSAEFLTSRSPLRSIADVQDIAAAVLYLTQSGSGYGEQLDIHQISGPIGLLGQVRSSAVFPKRTLAFRGVPSRTESYEFGKPQNGPKERRKSMRILKVFPVTQVGQNGVIEEERQLSSS